MFALVPAVGAGVIYPMVTQFGGGRKISLKQISDFEQKCWASIQGEQDEDGSFKKKLLACFEDSDLSTVEFYFYDETEGTTNILPKAVTEVMKTQGSHGNEFNLTLSGGDKKAISASGSNWNSVFERGIKGGCKIEITKNTDQGSKKLSCGNPNPQKLEEFKKK